MRFREAGTLTVLSTPVLSDAISVVGDLARDDGLRALVIRGADDRAFIGGADIKEMLTLGPASARAFITRVAAFCEALRQFPTPVIARLSGWCLGAGLEVAAACDIRISDETAQFGMPEVAVGIPSVVHGALLPRLIGSSRASWMMLTGANVSAATALGWGLVHDVCPTIADLDIAVALAAERFVDLSAAAVRQQKRLLRSWENISLEEAIRTSIDEFASAFETDEPNRWMTEFLDRKRPESATQPTKQ
jgi:enoyl-CoA hydratase/carnithine racemase